MEGIVQVGQPMPIGVTLSPGLSFVAAKIYDVSGAPVLLATVPLTNYSGSSYTGKYTPLSTGLIGINKAVYTDGTYATIDDSQPQGDDAVEVFDFTSPVVVFKPVPIVSVAAILNGAQTFDAEIEGVPAVVAELDAVPTLVAIIAD